MNRRILFVLNELRIGGAETQALLLADVLRRNGWDPRLLGLANPGPLQDRCAERGIRCLFRSFRYPWSRYYRPLYYLKMWGVLLTQRPAVVLSYTSVPNVLCGRVWKWAGIRGCIWNQRTAGCDRMPLGPEKAAARHASLFISNSQAGAEYLVRELGVDASRIRVVGNGIEIVDPAPETRRAVRRELSIEENAFVACMIGNLRAPKDQETLIRAWPAVADHFRRQNRTAYLLLAGRIHEEYGHLVALAETLNGSGAVRFLGYRPDVQDLLRAVDMCTFSSDSEGLPNGVLECMAAGLPVVATDLADIRACLPERQRGGLVPPKSPGRFAETIIRTSEPADMLRAGDANREHVRRLYSVERLGRETAALIEGMLP